MSDHGSIPRVHRPTRKDFEAQYVARNRPVIITGVVGEWPATKLWSPAYVNAALGQKEVTVTYSNPGRDNQTPRSQVPADEFFAEVEQPRESGNPYLNMQPTPAALMKDVELPIYFDHAALLFNAFAFGCRTITEMHYHQSTEAFFCCIKGSKRFVMYGPEQSPLMYAQPYNRKNFQHSQVVHAAPDLARFPKFARARPIEVTIETGEMLYVPIHWWHAVYGSPGLNINLTLFWYASGKAVLFPKSGKLHQWASLLVMRPNELAEGVRRFLRGV